MAIAESSQQDVILYFSHFGELPINSIGVMIIAYMTAVCRVLGENILRQLQRHLGGIYLIVKFD